MTYAILDEDPDTSTVEDIIDQVIETWSPLQ
jgi:hypothetical protein